MVLHHFNALIVTMFNFKSENSALSAQNDLIVRCEFIVIECEFLLVYKNFARTQVLFVATKIQNCIRKLKNIYIYFYKDNPWKVVEKRGKVRNENFLK